MKKKFTLVSELTKNEVRQQIIKLFDSESVEYQVKNNEILSLKTPFPLINVDHRIYTKHNWVGINPFIFISGINMTLSENPTGGTVIYVNIDQTKGVMIYFLLLLCLVSIIFYVPNLWAGIVIFLLSQFINYLIIFTFFIDHILKNEIEKEL